MTQCSHAKTANDRPVPKAPKPIKISPTQKNQKRATHLLFNLHTIRFKPRNVKKSARSGKNTNAAPKELKIYKSGVPKLPQSINPILDPKVSLLLFLWPPKTPKWSPRTPKWKNLAFQIRFLDKRNGNARFRDHK